MSFDNFSLLCLNFQLCAQEDFPLPVFKGSTLRGAFGYAFKKAVCITRHQPNCKNCILTANCAYSYIFETPRPAGTEVMRKYEKVPHPFILRPPLKSQRLIKTGEELSFGLVLMGRARDYLPYFVLVMEELAARGLGRERGKCSLQQVSDHRGSVIYDCNNRELLPVESETGTAIIEQAGAPPAELTIEFQTPLRLVRERKIIRKITFQDIFRSLLRRLAILQRFHCGLTPEIDFRGLIDQAAAIETVTDETCWQESRRYSTRQKASMSTSGLIGQITFTGDFKPFWPVLVLGTYVNVGKNTSFGLGKYEIIEKALQG
jgi:CRISPR/Cas system endoribonuclease Cas6 (RAMP superfamily)